MNRQDIQQEIINLISAIADIRQKIYKLTKQRDSMENDQTPN